jgi:hypothetical protein
MVSFLFTSYYKLEDLKTMKIRLFPGYPKVLTPHGMNPVTSCIPCLMSHFPDLVESSPYLL